MTDNEIIKTLERCSDGTGKGIIKATLDLINRKDEQIESLIAGQETLQKYIAEKDAEIEMLEKENKEIFDNYTQAVFLQTKRINEAVKEFAERLKKDLFYKCGDMNYTETCEARRLIDNLVKERVGEG